MTPGFVALAATGPALKTVQVSPRRTDRGPAIAPASVFLIPLFRNGSEQML
jgi:hypothetical protein